MALDGAEGRSSIASLGAFDSRRLH